MIINKWINLLVFINFIYQIVACVVQGEHIGYYVTFIIVVFLGLFHETFELTWDLYPHIRKWYIGHRQSTAISSTSSDEPQRTEDVQVSYKLKTKAVLKDYLLHSVGEFLIFPCLTCSLYGYINEKSWQFNNGAAVFNFVLFIYTVIIDAFCIKFKILQKIIRVSYVKYDALKDELIDEFDEQAKLWKYFSPLCMTIPVTVLLTLLHGLY